MDEIAIGSVTITLSGSPLSNEELNKLGISTDIPKEETNTDTNAYLKTFAGLAETARAEFTRNLIPVHMKLARYLQKEIAEQIFLEIIDVGHKLYTQGVKDMLTILELNPD